MPQTDKNQVFDGNGNLISETTVQVPLRVVSDADLALVKSTLKSMMTTFYPGRVPTGTPTAAQQRNWLIALTVACQYLYNAMDND